VSAARRRRRSIEYTSDFYVDISIFSPQGPRHHGK